MKNVNNSPNVRSINAGCPNRSAEMEKQLAACIRQRRGIDIALCTHHVISKALAMDPFFKGDNKGVLRSWVYHFLHRNHLSIRRRTHVGQKLNGHLQAIRDEFVEAVNERFMPQGTMEGTPTTMIVNIDETAVYYVLSATKTINETRATMVAVRGYGSNPQRLTACFAWAQDGTKLPLFLVFKAKPGGLIERRLDTLLP
ncbi:hypothetical protein BBJ28_00005981 [Nothophytophthora sp. Chile5]|nr:hypothetical protein BBJ28_00005981 [Nothophytophthora sp. Chile5]